MSESPIDPASRERLSRAVYGALWFAATPVIVAYLLWRSRRQPAYRHGWSERFLGRYGRRPAARCLWIHAVSVGETRAAAPLVAALQAAHPTLPILVTHMTPTGRETAEALFGDRVGHAYLAYDYPHAVAAFFRHWRPLVGVVMETEIWPNLMVAAGRAGTPMVLANARLSPKSLVAARRWPALMQPAARRFARILAQAEADAKRFAILLDTEFAAPAASSVTTIGNVKFDVEPPAAQRALAGRFRERIAASSTVPPRVFVCASTREGEEEGIVDAWIRHAVADGAPVLLVIVPRHPQRFDAVAAMAAAMGLVVLRGSDDQPLRPGVLAWVGDSMGELWAYYLAADVAYVGGSIVPLGGQNLIEAAAAACPVLIGRHTFNFAVARDEAVRAGAAVRVADYDALAITAVAIASDPARRGRMGQAGTAFAAAHRGATARTVAVLEKILDVQGGAAADFKPL